MATHARLRNEFTEDEKCHNLVRWLKLLRSTQATKLQGNWFDIYKKKNVKIKMNKISKANWAKYIFKTVSKGL